MFETKIKNNNRELVSFAILPKARKFTFDGIMYHLKAHGLLSIKWLVKMLNSGWKYYIEVSKQYPRVKGNRHYNIERELHITLSKGKKEIVFRGVSYGDLIWDCDPYKEEVQGEPWRKLEDFEEIEYDDLRETACWTVQHWMRNMLWRRKVWKIYFG